MDDLNDFGTGLRAHLGLEEEQIELLAESVVAAAEPEVVEPAFEGFPEVESSTLETLIAFEQELLERERHLARREQALAARAGALLTAAKSLHDAVVGAPVAATRQKPGDELARLRRRKSGAA
jgi:hypothetical protein